MGTMSASDAAPLPRLGEVFFDVRGNSRSMRLSWYADTGVAVMSIWQGGMCTGTFRLAIGDLPRMVETLQRGPGGWDSQAPGQAMADPLMESTAQVQSMEPLPGQGRPDLSAEPADYLTGAREYPDHRGGPPEYPAEPPDHRAMPPEYRSEPPEYRAGPPDEFRTGPAQYRAGSPDYPDQAGTREYLAPPPDRRAEPPEHRAGPPEYPAGPPEYGAGSPEYQSGPPGHRAGPPGYQPGPTEYPAGPPGHRAGPPDRPAEPPDYQPEPRGRRAGPPAEHRGGPPEYQSGPPDHLAGPPEYLAEPPDYQPEPRGHRAGPPEYPSGPPDHLAGPPAYQPEPRGHRAGPPDHPAGPPNHPAEPPEYRAGPPEYPAAPPRPRTEYLADLPSAADGADPAGYGSAIYVGSRRPDATDPDTSGTAAYPHDTGSQVNYRREPADDLYRGTGPLDYHGEPSMPHYPPGTSAPTSSDALGRSPADYPAHYGTALTDDIGYEPRQDSFPYGRPARSPGARSRHSDPGASSA
jgi:hypothetical protein